MNRIKELILKVLREEITDAERRDLDLWLADSPENQTLFDEINDPVLVAQAMGKMETLHEEAVWNRIQAHQAVRQWEENGDSLFSVPARRTRRTWMVAAAVILLLGAGGYSWWQFRTTATVPVAQAPAHDVLPGSNKAVLTLSNGKQIVLDSAANGALAQQGGARVLKTDSGRIAYSSTASGRTEVMYNTLATPRGGQYQLTLPDGTKVWLNAASSIRYPVLFIGSERRVEVTGETYFEVAKDASKPFKVVFNGHQEVDVLGTSFDINAYSDETEGKTTLLEGSIKQQGVILRRGQQARWKDGQRMMVQNDADVEEAVAWKNGKFIFSGDDIASVMRQISRWYDVDVNYKGEFKGDEFVGVISRFKNVSEILNMLEQTRTVKFTVEGRRITVLPFMK